jgi:hypothetical protein
MKKWTIALTLFVALGSSLVVAAAVAKVKALGGEAGAGAGAAPGLAAGQGVEAAQVADLAVRAAQARENYLRIAG